MTHADRPSFERDLASVVVGLVTAAVVVIALEPTLRSFYPVALPDPTVSAEEYRRMMASLPAPTAALLWSLFAVASLAGGLASTLTAGRGRRWPALITGGALMVAGTLGVLSVHQPLWFRAASLLTYPMAYVGYLAVRRPHGG